MKTKLLIGFSLILLNLGCRPSDQPEEFREYQYDFADDTQGWTAMFSDYPKGEELYYELTYQHTRLPSPLDTNMMAVMISGNNHSDDLFSCIFKKLDGFVAGRTYQVTFDIDLASSVPSNAIGIGGSPDLALGAGGISYQPKNNLDESNWYRPNFTVKLQSALSNEIMQVIGKIGVTDTTTVFTLINRNNLDKPIMLTTDEYGELWLLIGTDSGFEGKTTLYFKSITVRLKY
jgi:hypothetical protein